MEVLALLLERTKLILYFSEFNCQLLQLKFFLVVRLDNVLILLTVVGKNNDSSGDLESKLVEIFVTLFDLLVKGLILDLQLFVIDQVETFSKLLLSSEDLLLIGKSVPQSNVLQSILMNFLILGLVVLFPVFDHLCT